MKTLFALFTLYLVTCLCVLSPGCSLSDKKEEKPAAESATKISPKKEKKQNPFASLSPTTVGQHKGGALYVGFSPDGKYLVSTGNDNLVKLWDLGSATLAKSFKGHSKAVAMADFSPDQKLLVSVSKDTTARIWNIARGRVLKVLKDRPPKKMTEEEELAYAQRPEALMNWAVFTPDGQSVITASDDFALKFWSVAKGKKQKEIRDEGCRQRRVYRRRDGPGWITSSGCLDDGIAHLKFWDEKGNLMGSHGDADHDAHYLAFDRKNQFIIGADGNVSFSVYSSQGTFLKRKMVGVYHLGVVFGPADETLLVGTIGGDIWVYGTDGLNRVGEICVCH